jgi:NAD(P)-dependent dehydrogenase (short-subunit alcohol dehydrogenase family)
MDNLTGKTAVITGGGSGIGQATAIRMGRLGIRVVVCGRRLEPLQQTVAEITKGGGEAVAVQADVAEEAGADQVLETALMAYGSVDILVNNAGISGGSTIHDHSVEEWDRVLAVNLRGPFLMTRAALPHMRRQKSGHILNISSESAMEHYPGDGAYGVAKHALNALSEYAQRENQELGIRVDVICPGMVVTEMTEKIQGLNHEKCLYPEDIAELVLWLVSRRANIKIGRPILIQTMANPWAQ